MSERLNRNKYTKEDALQEINMAEHILDGMGAKKGVTLWGRIASIKARMEQQDAKAEIEAQRQPSSVGRARGDGGMVEKVIDTGGCVGVY